MCLFGGNPNIFVCGVVEQKEKMLLYLCAVCERVQRLTEEEGEYKNLEPHIRVSGDFILRSTFFFLATLLTLCYSYIFEQTL